MRSLTEPNTPATFRRFAGWVQNLLLSPRSSSLAYSRRPAAFSEADNKGRHRRQVAAVLAARGALGGAIVCAFLIYAAGSAYVASLIVTLILGCLAGWLARGCL